eukprot:COSAG05_NODE_18697_length_304_cov_1.014634_1_plen_77_part_01
MSLRFSCHSSPTRLIQTLVASRSVCLLRQTDRQTLVASSQKCLCLSHSSRSRLTQRLIGRRRYGQDGYVLFGYDGGK